MDLVEKPEQVPTIAAAYDKMGELIRHNADQQFGGAFVITPPVNNDGSAGQALDALFISGNSAAMFWATLKTIVEQQLAEIDSVQLRGRAGFGRG